MSQPGSPINEDTESDDDYFENSRKYSIVICGGMKGGDGSMQSWIDKKTRSKLVFDDMGLKFELLRGIYSYGFETPSTVQQNVIPPLIAGYGLTKPISFVCQAESGSGKNGSYMISMLQNLDEENKDTQALLLLPSREWAINVFHMFSKISTFMNFKIACCVGGTKVSQDIKKLSEGQHIVVGTPGRMKHLIENNCLDVSHLKIVCFNVLDELLSRGFRDHLCEMIRYFPPSVRYYFFSCTLPQEVQDFIDLIVDDPVKIICKRKEETMTDGNKNFYVSLKDTFKLPTLVDILDYFKVPRTVIFCNSRKRVDLLLKELKKEGNLDILLMKLSSSLLPEERKSVLKNFFKKTSCTIPRILLCTDLVGRMVPKHRLNMIINYDIPRHRQNYRFRVGRHRDVGKSRRCVTLNFVTERDVQTIKELEKIDKIEFKPLPTKQDGECSVKMWLREKTKTERVKREDLRNRVQWIRENLRVEKIGVDGKFFNVLWKKRNHNKTVCSVLKVCFVI